MWVFCFLRHSVALYCGLQLIVHFVNISIIKSIMFPHILVSVLTLGISIIIPDQSRDRKFNTILSIKEVCRLLRLK